ncbi:MAG TPA: hypothetical protein VK906_15030 [Egicoccus sp.]|nr:hypothetical protein [Egicoccus sp.]HSK24497.1 hypothetical protein [Egicoccus sp.]
MLLRKRFLSLAAVASLAVAGVACSDDGGTDDLDTTEDTLEDGAEDTGEELEDGAEETGDTLEEGGDEMEEEVEGDS